MDKVSVITVVLLTVITLAVIVAALFFLPDVIPLHFGPTGAGTVVSKFFLLLFVPAPALIYAAVRRKSRRDR